MDGDKRRANEIVQKYVKKMKHRVKILQRSNEKIRSGYLEKPRVKNRLKNGRYEGSERSHKQISFSYLSGNLKVVYKHLGKGKEQHTSNMQQKIPNHINESMLMEVQIAIQGDIAHCK